MAIDISKIQFPDPMNIREAALYLNLGEQRVRTLHRTEELKADDTSGRLMFKKADLDAWKAQPRKTGGGARAEGAAGKAYVIHVTGDKLAAVQKALEGAGIKLEQRYNYEKMRAYQKRRNEAKRAAKANGASQAVVPAEKAPVATTPAKGGVASVLSRK